MTKLRRTVKVKLTSQLLLHPSLEDDMIFLKIETDAQQP